MRIQMTNAWCRAATLCGVAMSVAKNVIHAYPEQLPVLIDIFGVSDLSQPRR